MDERDLADLFRRLGARDPDAWARSQRHEGIPQLARFVFLRQAWRMLAGRSWVEALKAQPAAIGPATAALDRILAAGVAEEDLTAVVRSIERELLFSFCCLLSDPGDLEPEIADLAWGLFQLDEAGRPIAPIPGLHESVIETDPEGGAAG